MLEPFVAKRKSEYSTDVLWQEFVAIQRQLRTNPDTLVGRSTAGDYHFEEIPCTAAGRALLDDASASAQRTTLGLGTAATQTYTDGTWTPGISFGGGVVGITYTSRAGIYTRDGLIVHANCQIVLSSKGSSTGAALVTGLPFTVENTANYYAAATLRFNKVTFANAFQGYANINTTTVVLEEITEAGAVTSLADTDFANDSEVMVSVSYRLES